MVKAGSVYSPELVALCCRDRAELAAHLLDAAFGTLLGDPYPNVSGAELGAALARVGGVTVSNWSWYIRREPDATLARLVLELVLLWERSSLACRGLALETNEVVLLGRGEQLLRAGGVAAVRSVLT